MGPLLPAFSPAPASAGAANGLTDQLRQGELVVSGGLLPRAVDRQASAAGLELRSGPPVQHLAGSERRLHHIDIDIDIQLQAGGEQHGLINNPARDHAKTDLEGSGDDGTLDASVSTSSEPPRPAPIDGTDDSRSSTSDDTTSDSSSIDVGEDYNSDNDDNGAASSSTTTSAISSTSSLHSSASSSSLEASTLTTTASSRRNHRDDVAGEGEDCTALVLIGCRMCLTYYMVGKPADACPRCGDQGDHIVRFGG